MCRGIDHREVSPEQERKSVSVEETYTPDVPDLAACLALLPELFASLQARVKRCGAEEHVQKLYVKIRFADFHHTTAECVGSKIAFEQLAKLMDTAFQRGQQPVRLLGVGVRLGENLHLDQLSLFADV